MGVTVAQVAEARIVALIKDAHGPEDLTADGTAIHVETEPPTYDTLDGRVVICHYECRIRQGYELTRRVVGDVIVENQQLTTAQLLVDMDPAELEE